MKNTLDDFRVYQKSEVDKFADIFYQGENQSAGDLGKLQGQLRPAVDRYEQNDQSELVPFWSIYSRSSRTQVD